MVNVKNYVAEFVILRYIILLTNPLRGTYVQGACLFPASIRGIWVRGRDTKSLTFTESDITGMDIKYNSQTLGSFYCRMSSGDTYVISSSNYSTTIEDKRYYICWKLQEVANSAYLLYELTDVVADSSYQGEPGIIESDTYDSTITLSQVCTRRSSTLSFTTLIKKGATIAGAPCPQQIIAKYSYALCPDSELDFCSNPGTVKADYSKCPTKVFNSASGVLACMGHVSLGDFTYLNLLRQDAGNAVTCFRFQVVTPGTISGQYYSGDCTTTASGTSLTLTKAQECTAARNSTNTAPAVVAGIIVGVVLLVAALLVICFLIKKNMSWLMSVSHNNNTAADLKEHNSNISNEVAGQLDKTEIDAPSNGEVTDCVNGSGPEGL